MNVYVLWVGRDRSQFSGIFSTKDSASKRAVLLCSDYWIEKVEVE